jgi:hypothetical protein
MGREDRRVLWPAIQVAFSQPSIDSTRKLSALIYRLLRWGQPRVDEGAVACEKPYQETRFKSLYRCRQKPRFSTYAQTGRS